MLALEIKKKTVSQKHSLESAISNFILPEKDSYKIQCTFKH